MGVAPSPFASAQLDRALLLMLTKLLDRIVTRRCRRAWMIECVRRQSGSMLPWIVVVHLQTCTWGWSPTTGRHKDICGVLRKWRDVVKDGVSPDSCTAELVAFLQ